MDPSKFEELFPQAGDDNSPGSQLYLYRLLQLAAGKQVSSSGTATPSYQAVKKLSERLGIASGNQLASLFRDLGLGKLDLEIGKESIMVTLDSVSSASSASKRSKGKQGACDLERGLIDGALELITGLPVTTIETRCQSSGDETCCFEAVLDNSLATPSFIPGNRGGINRFSIADSLQIPPPGGAGITAGHSGDKLRAWFMDLAGRELARARRHGRQLAVMYVDLDDLGRINSAHGRAAGDQVLHAVATALSRGCRSEDFLWHQGEDEFALVLSETGAEGAGIVAHRLSLEVLSAAEYVDVAARISASIGFSVFPVHAEDVPGLFNSARSAVYLAKSMGKGRYQAAKRLEGVREQDTAYKFEREPEPAAGSKVNRGQAHDESETGAAGEPSASDAHDQSEPTASIIVASGSPLLMAGMTQILAAAPNLEIVAEIADPGGLPGVITDQRPDLIFADLGMATESDFAAMKLLRDQNLACKMTVFAPGIDHDVIKLAADYSVDGVILHDSAPQEILAALKKIFQGQPVLPANLQEAMSELNKNRRLLKELSEREVEVLRLIAEGKSNSQISNELFITVNTVRFHLANIYQKLSVSNRTEAANYYLRQDLAPDGQTRLL